ncbi:MAG: hypothetical protein JWL81_3126 [Verrucomicrobiales bacterium]|nr:hypothetical protein [Verrucomicrobiales bacterium]
MKLSVGRILAVAGWVLAAGLIVMKMTGPAAVPDKDAPVAAPAGKTGPRLDVEMDFSGTGLADETWKLTDPAEPSSPPAKVPDHIPSGESGGKDSGTDLPGQPLPPRELKEWSPDSTLKLDIRPTPAPAHAPGQ